MKSLQLVLLLVLPAIIVGVAVQNEKRPVPPLDCSLVLCARPLCANPVTPPGECCPSCDDSNCKFEGCVNFNDEFGTEWRPNPCKICRCDVENNQQFCGIIDCFFLKEKDCNGYPVITRPGECCPSCDFGTPEIGCHVVPQILSKRNITVTQSRGFKPSCTIEVQKHTCDKFSFGFRGKKFRCDPISKRRLVRFEKNCPLVWGVREDVTYCKAVEDKTLTIGCDLKV